MCMIEALHNFTCVFGTCDISHVKFHMSTHVKLCVSHIKFLMWNFTCVKLNMWIWNMWLFTCEHMWNYVFHMWSFTCEISHVNLEVSFSFYPKKTTTVYFIRIGIVRWSDDSSYGWNRLLWFFWGKTKNYITLYLDDILSTVCVS
jgi:hypothetical protein